MLNPIEFMPDQAPEEQGQFGPVAYTNPLSHNVIGRILLNLALISDIDVNTFYRQAGKI